MRGYPDWMDGLSVRARNTLFRLDCKTLNCAKKVSYVQFLRVPDCGRRTAGELCEFFGTLNSNNGTQFVNNTLWQPIETAPKDGKQFLCLYYAWQGARLAAVIHWDCSDETWWIVGETDDGVAFNKNFMGWMPLPEPPNA